MATKSFTPAWIKLKDRQAASLHCRQICAELDGGGCQKPSQIRQIKPDWRRGREQVRLMLWDRPMQWGTRFKILWVTLAVRWRTPWLNLETLFKPVVTQPNTYPSYKETIILKHHFIMPVLNTMEHAFYNPFSHAFGQSKTNDIYIYIYVCVYTHTHTHTHTYIYI